MKKYLLSMLLTLSLIVFGFREGARNTQSLAGEWEINVHQSEGGQASPKEIKLKLTKDSIFITRTTNDGKTFLERMSFDGNTNTCITTSGRKKSGSSKWDEERKSFTENATLSDSNDPNKIDFTVIEHWQLSDDQKQLTVKLPTIAPFTELLIVSKKLQLVPGDAKMKPDNLQNGSANHHRKSFTVPKEFAFRFTYLNELNR